MNQKPCLTLPRFATMPGSPVTLAGRLGLSQLVDNHVDLGDAPGAGQHRGQDTDPGGIRSGWRRLHRRHRRVACGQDLLGTGLCGQGSIHAGDLPAQFPVGTCATAGPGEPGVAGARLGRRGRPRGLASDDRHRLDGLRDLWTGKGGSAPAQLHRPAGLSSAAGRCRRNRRRADGTTAQGPSQHRPGAANFLRETVARVRHAGATGALTVRADSGFYAHTIVAVCRKMDVRFSITIRQHPRLRNLIEAIPETDWTPIPLLDGRRSLRCRDHLHSLRQSTRRRTSAPHRPQGEAHARLPTGVFHQLQLSRFHHGPRGRHPPTGSRPPPTRRGGERHPRPEVRRRTEPSALGTLCRQRRLVSRAGDGSQSGSLDLPHRTGRTSLHHQDPAQTVLLPRRTAYTLGPLSHPASSPALALGNTVRPRSGQTANHSVTELTADGDDCPPYTP